MIVEIVGWIENHSAILSALSSVVMVLIWLAYLQVFLMEFTRLRRTSIVISRSAGSGLGSHCFVCNMGSQPIFIVAIVARLVSPNDDVHVDLTDPKPRDDVEEDDLVRRSRQRPLTPGSFMDCGSFSSALDALNRRRGFDSEHAERLPTEDGSSEIEVLVFAVHSADDNMVAARRQFRLERRDGHCRLVPKQLTAHQIRSRRTRERLRREWEKSLLS